MSLSFTKNRMAPKTDPDAYLNSDDEGSEPINGHRSPTEKIVINEAPRRLTGSENGYSEGSNGSGGTPVIADKALTKVQISFDKTPTNIAHLHAALEHQIGVLLENATIRNSVLENDSPSIIGITSAIKGEGKSTVALHLALSVARDSFKSVCLIDLSLDDDNMARRLGMRGTDGIIQVLEGSSNKIPTLGIEGFDNLAVIPAGGGRSPLNPARIARSPHVMEIIAAARTMYDLVIVDLPAVSTGNALPLASHFDAVIMVVNAGVTPKQIVNDALDYIGRQRTLGVVLNRIKPSMPQWLHKQFSRSI